ncbi:unnamed protein product [Diamesa tonsa]
MSVKSLIPKRHIVEESDDDDDSMSSMSEFIASSGTGSGRKRKLDHLTWEEKVQRKKLKNRVAAQTSRDRKKKQMEEMQTTIDIQAKQINSLQVERDRIKVKYEKLEEDCQKLKLRLDMQEQRPNIDLLEDFDFSKLEELAESLLADVTTNLETSNPGSRPTIAQIESQQQRLFESVVGTCIAGMESTKDSSCSLNTHDDNETFLRTIQSDFNRNYKTLNNNEEEKDQTIYADDEIPVEESECLEISDLSDQENDEDIYLNLKSEPTLRLLSPIPPLLKHYDNFKNPSMSPSDNGYESHGSPNSMMSHDFYFNNDPDEFLNELFPSLI